MMAKRAKQIIQKLGTIELPEEEASQFEHQIEIADAEVASEVRVNFRWGGAQVSLIKMVAELMGIPYQTYMKQVLYRQAFADLKQYATVYSASGAQPDAGQQG